MLISTEDSYEVRPLTQLFVFDKLAAEVGTLHKGHKFTLMDTNFDMEGCAPGKLLRLDNETINFSAFVSVLYCISHNSLLMDKLLRYKEGKGSSTATVTLFNNISNSFTELEFERKYMLRNNKANTPVSFSLVSNVEGYQKLMDLEAGYMNHFSKFDDFVSALLNNDPLDYFITFTGASRWKIDMAGCRSEDTFATLRTSLQRGLMVVAGRRTS